jgi:hypothetical protein
MVDDLAFVSEQITAARDTLSLRIKTIIDEKENAIVKQTIKSLDSLHSLIVAEKSSLFADSEDKIREKLAGIYGTINQYAGKPSAEQLKRIDNIAKDIQSIKLTLDTVFSNQISMCNSILSGMRKKPIKRLSREEFDSIQ